MLEKIKRLPWSWFITVLIFAFILYQRMPQISKNFALEGATFPTLHLLTTNNLSITFPPQPEKPSVVLFWAISCGPCRLEMERIQKAIAKNELAAERIFAVHVGGNPQDVAGHMNKHGFTFPALVDPESALAGALDVTMTPTLFLIAPHSKIQWASSGLGFTDVWRMKNFLGNR